MNAKNLGCIAVGITLGLAPGAFAASRSSDSRPCSAEFYKAAKKFNDVKVAYLTQVENFKKACQSHVTAVTMAGNAVKAARAGCQKTQFSLWNATCHCEVYCDKGSYSSGNDCAKYAPEKCGAVAGVFWAAQEKLKNAVDEDTEAPKIAKGLDVSATVQTAILKTLAAESAKGGACPPQNFKAPLAYVHTCAGLGISPPK